MTVIAKLRIGYLIQCTVIVGIFLIPIILLLKDDGTNSVLNINRFWFGLAGFVWLFGGALFFLYRRVLFITVADQGITFATIFGKTFKYNYYDIAKIEIRSATLKRRYYSSPGYQIITIDFKDGKSIEISANTYANFEKIKNKIYSHVYPPKNVTRLTT